MTLPTLSQISDIVGEELFLEWQTEGRFHARLHSGHDAEYYHAHEWSFIQRRYQDYIAPMIASREVSE